MMKNSQQSWLKRWKTSRYEHRNTNICLDGVVRTDVCVRAYSLQDVFTPAGWPSLWAFHMTERERRNERKTEKKRKGGRERERQKYRERAGTLGQTDHQWPSFPQLCQWLNWSLLPGWLCVWMRCVHVSQNTHRWSYFFKWMSYNHISTLDGLWLFFLPSDYCLLPTAWKHRMTTKMTEILCFVKSLPSSL